jgi:hypothetical protein
MFFSCAKRTTSEPGSATAGQPASDNNPIECPSLHGFKYFGISEASVNLFKTKSVSLSCDLLGPTAFINRRADFSLSTI